METTTESNATASPQVAPARPGHRDVAITNEAMDQVYNAKFEGGMSHWYKTRSCDAKEVMKQLQPWLFYETFEGRNPVRIFDFEGKENETVVIKYAMFDMEQEEIVTPLRKSFDEFIKDIHQTNVWDDKQLEKMGKAGALGKIFRAQLGWDALNIKVKHLVRANEVETRIRVLHRQARRVRGVPQSNSDSEDETASCSTPNCPIHRRCGRGRMTIMELGAIPFPMNPFEALMGLASLGELLGTSLGSHQETPPVSNNTLTEEVLPGKRRHNITPEQVDEAMRKLNLGCNEPGCTNPLHNHRH